MNRSLHWLIGLGSGCLLSSCSSLPFTITITPSNEATPAETSEETASAATAEDSQAEVETVADTPATTTETETASSRPSRNYFREAVTRAESAVAIGQAAQSSDDWQLAANRWQQAVQYMQQVPTGDPNHATAQQKVKEYGQNLALAKQRAAGQPSTPQAPPTTAAPNRPAGLVATIPIVDSMGGTPVVPVTLHGNRSTQDFTMLFDTGASGTLITQAMANAIGVVVTGEALVTVADGRQVQIPVGYVSKLQVGDLVVENVWVAIGGDVGLLGQDIYGQYGLSIGGSQINLYE